MHSYFESQCKYLLFTKYLTSTYMPTAQQKKRRQTKNTFVVDCFALFGAHQHDIINQINDSHGQSLDSITLLKHLISKLQITTLVQVSLP